ncbi:MAG: shikimate dehydrogenase [Caulobacterales bacterium]|nr:shikimate dehydrogenase [Caulobacterales bacterium]
MAAKKKAVVKPAPPKTAGVVGWPVGHSLSPLIHQTFASREGVDAVYLPIAVEPGYTAFERAMDALKAMGVKGVNVTIPHKEHALKYAASASDAAKAAGAANMLTFRDDGPYADNSDIIGFASGLEAILTANDKRGRAVVLGAGGAARGVIIALKSLGFSPIVILNRTAEKAEVLAKELGGETAPWDSRNQALAGASLLVNTTSLGMTGEPPLEIDLAGLPETAIVADIVYKPLETALLAAAKARGLRVMDGLSMLMHQAVPGYKAWLGSIAVVDADLRARLEKALEARS